MNKIRIALLAGGWSGERDVSLKSAEAVYNALDKSKYDVSVYDPQDSLNLKRLTELRDNVDLVFNLLHGKHGEDGRIQGLLDILGIEFIGSGVLSSAMAFNKKIAKDIYRTKGLMVAKDIILRTGEDIHPERFVEILGLPAVVKPVAEGSSLGISVCQNMENLVAGIQKAFEFDHEVMVEEFIDGQEITCCVLGNRVLETLPVVEIVPGDHHCFFDYEAKYKNGATQEICPARLSQSITERAQLCATEAHEALKCRVWSRSDMIIKDEDIYLLETNTIPGMTQNSLFPLAARAAGIPFPRLLDKLIGLSLTKNGA